MLSVAMLLVLVAFVCTILNAMSPSRCPLWVAVLLLCVIGLLQVLPLK